MDARETWQALQARLTHARAAFDAGDRSRALAEIAAALDIDPNFLAAHSLRDRILHDPEAVPASSVLPPASAEATSSEIVGVADPPDGYARFEQRARQRRVDRRLDAARAALEDGHLEAAAMALDEVSELDPTVPELPQLSATVDELRRKATDAHRGPRFVAAAVFAATVLAASMLHDSRALISRRLIATAPLVAISTPPVSVPAELAVVETVSRNEPTREPHFPPLTLALAHAVITDLPPAALPPAEPEIVQPPPPVVVPVPRPAVQEAAAVASISMPLPPPAPAPAPADDDQLIRQALERYRTAYEGLDAQSAHAVWPAVDQAALARAFDGIESQWFTFESCDVRMRGELATATCEGMMRYIPKIGSREPRTEPRVWSFSLSKAGGVWKIESARAER